MAKKQSYDAYQRQQIGGLIDQLQLSRLDRQLLKERWLDQMIWADKKAAQTRQSYYRLRLTTVVGGVLLPALVGISLQLGSSSQFFRVWFPPLTFLLSQVIAVSVAIEEFCKFGDRWRDYRKMAEDLKSEGWQYLQSSGPYEAIDPDEPNFAHEQGFAQFTNRVESIIKNDVQSYISGLMQQQAKQDAEAQKALGQAQSVVSNKTLIGQMNPNYQNPNAPPPGTVPASYSGASGYANPPSNTNYPVAPGYPSASGYPAAPGYPSPGNPITAPMNAFGNGQPPQMTPQIATTPAPIATPMVTTPIAPPSPVAIVLPPAPARAPTDLNAAILGAAKKLKNMSTAIGPDGGNNACAWTVNQVLHEANIPALGKNPDYVPDLLEELEAGRGQKVSPQEAKAGDLVIAHGEAHIGISMNDGCQTVLSNSSSRASFCWESDVNYQNSYGGSSTVYRLLR